MSIKAVVKSLLKKLFNIGPENINDYRKRGVIIGENVEIINCTIDYGHGYLIEIGDNCIITHTTILTHDASTKIYLGYSKVGRVRIGNNVFIGQGSIILPGVSIGNNVIIGAGSVVKKDIPDQCVAAGNPAEILCPIDVYIEKNRERMNNAPVYDVYWNKKTEADKCKMREDLADGTIGYDI